MSKKIERLGKEVRERTGIDQAKEKLSAILLDLVLPQILHHPLLPLRRPHRRSLPPVLPVVQLDSSRR